MTSQVAARPASEVVDHFNTELYEIESIFGTCVGGRTVPGFTIPYTPTEDGCLVSMWDAWNRFLRALTLNAAFGTFVGLSGAAYSPALPRIEALAMAHLAADRKGKAYNLIEGEPKWYNASHLADVMSTLGLDTTYSQGVIAAIGANIVSLGPAVITNPLEEIRTCRNFVAHKAAATLAHVGQYAQDQVGSLSTHLRHRRGGVETFSVWREGLSAIAAAAAQ